MNIYIFDFEVFRLDTLLGYGIVNLETGECEYHQTWDLDEMRRLYDECHEDTIWVGWNNMEYDDLIYETIVRDTGSPYLKSHEIIKEKIRGRAKFPFYSYDLTNGFLVKPSLKLTELLEGESIDTSEVDFDLLRRLTAEERRKTEKYNLSDLKRTFKNFCKFKGKFELRLSMIKEFGIPLQKGLHMTGTQIAAAALKAKKVRGIEEWRVKPVMYPTLRVKTKCLIDWYMNEDFREKKSLKLHICNTVVTIAAGGAHSTTKKFHCNRAIYADISGYYNLVMMNFDLLPRTLDDEGKEMYKFMYHEQLRLKKIDPAKRSIYKTVCLSVFGAMNNEYTDFYDPQKALLVTSTGEMFMMDLLEKLDGLGTAFNINTDGIMFEPFDWADEQKLFDIIQEWVDRNGFAVKTGIITDYHARDVNCYLMREPSGELCCKGEALKNYDISDSAFAQGSFFNCKEPPIIAQGIVAAFNEGILPEDFVETHKKDLRRFQYIAKKGSYDSLMFTKTDLNTREKTEEPVQSPTRCFAAKNDGFVKTIVKHRTKNGVHSSAKVSNLPISSLIYNGDFDDFSDYDQIDYDYYIKRLYERIAEFF